MTLETDPVSPAEAADRLVTCEVTAVEVVTPEIRIVRMRPVEGENFAYRAGQYARVAFGGFGERDYSIASRPVPGNPELAFHIRNMGGGGPSQYVAETLQAGERVAVHGPFGTTYLRPEKPGPILAICGGSGLAPMTAIVAEALAQGLTQPIHLYFGARRERDIYMEDHFRALAEQHPNFAFTPVLSDPDGPTARRTGLVHAAVAADTPTLTGCVAYLAGPPPMVEAAAAMCRDHGMAETDIHADAFIGEAERRARYGVDARQP
jgi:CDP-4-dehydro-6-deoxyglucose reductase/ferredoxin-NAD(P)+ reductase (naphthalene dioxygenase ferredoxin-specific)